MPVSSLRDQLRDLLLKAEMLSDGGELLNVIKVSMRNVHGRVMFVDETTVEFQSKEIREAAASGRRERRQEISYVRTETTKRSGGGKKRKLEIEEKAVSKQEANPEDDTGKVHSASSEDAVRSFWGGKSGSDASANTSSYFYMVPVEKQTRRAVPFTDISSESSFLTATGSDSTASSSLISTMVDGKESTWRNPRPAPRLEEKTRCWTVRIGKVYGYEVSDGAIVVSTYSNPLNIAVESDDRNE